MSIRRFWGKRGRTLSKISSPLAPWEGLILRLRGNTLRRWKVNLAGFDVAVVVAVAAVRFYHDYR